MENHSSEEATASVERPKTILERLGEGAVINGLILVDGQPRDVLEVLGQ